MSYDHEQRIRYADTDRMGFAYHGRYFEWFEAARTEMLRKYGLAYSELEEKGLLLPVVQAGCRYRRPVLYDEWIHIKTAVAAVTRAKLTIEYRIEDSETETRAAGFTVHCYMNRSGRAVRIAPDWVEFFLGKAKIPAVNAPAWNVGE